MDKVYDHHRPLDSESRSTRPDLLHLGQEALTPGLLGLSGVLKLGKAHLTLGQGLSGAG